jgi:hypothetical protein
MSCLLADGVRARRVVTGSLVPALVKFNVGEGGQRFAFEHPVTDAPREREGLLPVRTCTLGLVQVLVRDRQPDERLGFRVTVADLARKLQRTLVMIGRSAVVDGGVVEWTADDVQLSGRRPLT